MPPMIAIDDAQRAAGAEMHRWLVEMLPWCRSLTGPGTDRTLDYLAGLLPGLETVGFASGSRAFDWTVPETWTLRSARLLGPDGAVVADSAVHNLHVVGYSEPVDRTVSLDELQPHLHSLPDLPDAIPYVTSYYRRTWGFCLPHRVRAALPPGHYRAVIDSTLAPGELRIGELVIPGDSPEEVLLSTYICHPSMANNELSGPVLAAALGRWLAALPRRRYTYRILFSVETIGAIAYLSRHLDRMRARVAAGFVLTCVGDERAVSYLESRRGGTLADRAAVAVLDHHAPGWTRYGYRDRGSDERQYGSPGVDLPVCSVMRSKYGTYPEYHTSLDDATLATPDGLAGSLALYQRILTVLERNRRWRTAMPCEPQLGKRGLYPTTSTRDTKRLVALQMDILAWCDGDHDLLALAARIGADPCACIPIIDRLAEAGVLIPVE